MTNTMLNPITIFLLLSFLFSKATADFFVSPSGNDASRGTKSRPFRSLERAQVAVRNVNKKMKSDITVFIAPGTYYLDKPLNFSELDSGYNGHRVIWQAQDMERGANISGG